MPKISVIIPVYNGEKYLNDCINSLLTQSLSDIEILAVNNGSIDNSLSILSSYNDKRLKIINLLENQGPAVARNKAIDIATGDYIAFCDCDDTVPQDAYFNLYNNATLTGVDVVVGDYTDCWGIKKEYKKICRASKNAYVICEMGVLWNKLYLRSFIENNKLRIPDYIGDEDILFLALLLQCNPSFSMQETSVYNYMHDINNTTSSSKLSNLKVIQDNIEVRLQYDNIIKNLGYETADSRAFYSYRYIFKKWCCVVDEQEREKSFLFLQKFVDQSTWNKTSARFKKLFGMRPDQFACIDYNTFWPEHYKYCFQKVIELEEQQIQGGKKPAFKIPVQIETEELFKSGKLGFRYIFRYFKYWLQYKLKRR